METTTQKNIDYSTEHFARFLDKSIGNILTSIGILPHRRGHFAIKDYVIDLLSNYPKSVMGNTYEYLQHKYRDTYTSIEACIRNAVKQAYDLKYFYRLNDIIGYEIVSSHFNLSNREFLAVLTQHCYNTFILPNINDESIKLFLKN